MKKLFTFWGTFILITNLCAQTIILEEDFESYPGNEYICIQSDSDPWRTWVPGSEGTEMDAKVKSNFSYQGNKSLYLKSTKGWGGGPTDVIYELPETYTVGKVTIEFWVYINNMAGGSWNFQGFKEATDTVYELNLGVDFATSGDGATFLYLDSEIYPSNDEIIFLDDYTGATGKWVHTKLVADLTSHNWEWYWDGEKVSTFQPYANRIGSINFYPRNIDIWDEIKLCEYWIDNLTVTYEPIEMYDYDALVYNIERVLGIGGYKEPIHGTFRNIGNETITQFDVSIRYNGTEVHKETINDTILPMGYCEYVSSDGVTLIEGKDIELELIISNINGKEDQDVSNNSKTTLPFVAANIPDKKILLEYSSNTNSRLSPAAYKYAERLRNKYPDHIIDVNLHTRRKDPKFSEAYYNDFKEKVSWGFLADNSFYFGRQSTFTEIETNYDVFKDFEEDFLRRINNWLPATIEKATSKTNLENDSTLTFNVTIKFHENILETDTLSVACIIRESEVTGTDKFFKQQNFWGGTTIDLMGLNELPDVIPAADIVFYNVGLECLGGVYGKRIEGSYAIDDTLTISFTTKAKPDWNLSKIEFVPVISVGEYNSYYEEEWYYYVTADVFKLDYNAVSISELPPAIKIRIFPNPTKNIITLTGSEIQNFSIFNTLGTVVLKGINSNNTIDVSLLESGIYFINGKNSNGQLFSTKFIKE